MKIEISGVTYWVKWSHKTVMVNKMGKGKNSFQEPRRSTICQIIDVVSGEEKAKGETICSPNDPFVKDKGRKISLARALDNYGTFPFTCLNKSQRKDVWDQYLNRPASLT